MKKPITLIKIGGSLITDKNKPFSVNQRILEIIASEVRKSVDAGHALVVGHGAGSFAHVPAKKYNTHKGLVQEDSLEGIARVAYAAKELNLIVMKSLLDAGVNAVSMPPISMYMANNFELGTIYTEPFKKSLDLGVTPVVYGDMIFDDTHGSTIFSTEKILGYLGLELINQGYKIKKIIHCGQTNGVYDLDGNTIPEINSQNFAAVQQSLGGSYGTDVTGGMLHKVEETLKLAQKGIPGMIIDGIENGSLFEAIDGKEVLGTKINK